MDHQVSIIQKSGERHDIHVAAGELAAFDSSTARAYIGDLFSKAGLETPNPMGKILLVDQVLLLAQEQKSARWAAPDADLKKFLAAIVCAMGRPTITIDLVNYTL